MTTFPWSHRTTKYSEKGYRIAQGYACPECGAKSRVVDSRDASVGIRRRRVCTGQAEHRFTTYEMTEEQIRSLTDSELLEEASDVIMDMVARINRIRRRATFKAIPEATPEKEPMRRLRRAD